MASQVMARRIVEKIRFVIPAQRRQAWPNKTMVVECKESMEEATADELVFRTETAGLGVKD